MGITRETGKQSRPSTDVTMNNKKNSKTPTGKTPGLFSSFRGKRPTVSDAWLQYHIERIGVDLRDELG